MSHLFSKGQNSPRESYIMLRNKVQDSLIQQGCFPGLTVYLEEATIQYVNYCALIDTYTDYIFDRKFFTPNKEFYKEDARWSNLEKNISLTSNEKEFFEILELAARMSFIDKNRRSQNASTPRNSNCSLLSQKNNITREHASPTREFSDLDLQRIAWQLSEGEQRDIKKREDEAIAFSMEEANRIKMEAYIEKNRLIAEAKTEKQRLLAEAEAEKQRLLAEAKAEKQRLLAEAETEKQQLLAKAECEKKRLIENISNEEIKTVMEKRINAHFHNEQLEERKLRENLNKEYNSLIQSKNDMLDSLNTGTQKLQSSLMLALTESFDKLQSVQNEINRELTEWQKRLYKNELGGIAQCFMNLDRIISAMEHNITKHLAFGEEGYHKEIAEELSKNTRNLKILKNNLEQSLAKNSIKLLIPQIGESFNSNYHRAENFDPTFEDEDDLNGKRITEVREPGLIRELNISDDPLFRAIVVIEK